MKSDGNAKLWSNILKTLLQILKDWEKNTSEHITYLSQKQKKKLPTKENKSYCVSPIDGRTTQEASQVNTTHFNLLATTAWFCAAPLTWPS